MKIRISLLPHSLLVLRDMSPKRMSPQTSFQPFERRWKARHTSHSQYECSFNFHSESTNSPAFNYYWALSLVSVASPIWPTNVTRLANCGCRFAVVAYPVQDKDSGIMIFVINKNGLVFQKDLGKNTDEVVAAITEFNPDKSWTIVE